MCARILIISVPLYLVVGVIYLTDESVILKEIKRGSPIDNRPSTNKLTTLSQGVTNNLVFEFYSNSCPLLFGIIFGIRIVRPNSTIHIWGSDFLDTE